jgi:hypothetical protein
MSIPKLFCSLAQFGKGGDRNCPSLMLWHRVQYPRFLDAS